MPVAYKPPGVTFTEVVSPSVSPFLAAPITVCLVGLAQGYIQRTDQIKLTGTTAVTLPGMPADANLSNVLKVVDAIDPTKGAPDGSGYVVTTDYTVNTTDHTITRVPTGAIADGATVNVTYQYVPSDYYVPIRLDDFGAVEDRFGSAYDPTGSSINSSLSYAAAIAFENGAGQSIVFQPLFTRLTPGDPTTPQGQPSTAQVGNIATWQDTLYNLREIEDIDILVPVIGQSFSGIGDATQLSIVQTFQDHMQFMVNDDQKYLLTVFGEDSSTSTNNAQRSTLISHANALAGRYGGSVTEQMVMVSPSKFTRELPAANRNIYVGGQYAAAAIAGMIAARAPQFSLTRQVVSGIVGVADSRSRQQMNDDAQAGMMVLMQNLYNVIVRHAITMSDNSIPQRTLSVVITKHFLIASVKRTLEEQVIGKTPPPPDDGSIMVKTATIGVLELLKTQGDILNYANVAARALDTDPTTVEVRFSYKPEFPIDYVHVIFSIDLTIASSTVATSTSGSTATP